MTIDMTDLPIEQQKLIFEVVVTYATLLEIVASEQQLESQVLHHTLGKVVEDKMKELNNEEIKEGVRDFFEANHDRQKQ